MQKLENVQYYVISSIPSYTVSTNATLQICFYRYQTVQTINSVGHENTVYETEKHDKT